MESTVLAREAELKALKAQVNPHFLFNSLNSISALTSIDPAKAREMCILLADFLRLTLGLGEKSSFLWPRSSPCCIVSCHRESALRLAPRNLRRYRGRLPRLLIPPLLLQPLLENAVTHGIANLPEGGSVRLARAVTDGILSILVENTCGPEATLTRNGLGLENVRRRLEARYGKRRHARVAGP